MFLILLFDIRYRVTINQHNSGFQKHDGKIAFNLKLFEMLICIQLQRITTTNLARQNPFAIDCLTIGKILISEPQTLDLSLLFETAMIRAIYKVGTQNNSSCWRVTTVIIKAIKTEERRFE